jgi:hypothetical protein
LLKVTLTLTLYFINSLREENAIISNIVSLAPIIFLKANKDTDFNHQVTITIPSPKYKSNGHLVTMRFWNKLQ